MKIKKHILLSTVSALLVSFLPFQTIAAVPERDVAKLGTTLTPLGGEKAGNAAGTIPAWEGLPVSAGAVDDGGFLADPFANEKPLFVITANNVSQHSQFLTVGQLEMFRRYNTYQMPVYPSHRTASVSPAVAADAKSNALLTTLIPNGAGLEHFKNSYPFPIPKNGQEIIWNHLLRYRGDTVKGNVALLVKEEDGSFTKIIVNENSAFHDALVSANPGKYENIMALQKYRIVTPANLSKNGILVRMSLNPIKTPTEAWNYVASQNRVRRAPQLAYDGDALPTGGIFNFDDMDLFNGSPDRYDWQLVGKKEIYVPYNNYKMDSPQLTYNDIVQPNHINPETTRYELHRVWHVIASLKPGQEHAYAKREFYFDEDSWQILHVDNYDNKGQLWRVAESFAQQYYHKQIPGKAADVYYDLSSGRYAVYGLRNEQMSSYQFDAEFVETDYSPISLEANTFD